MRKDQELFMQTQPIARVDTVSETLHGFTWDDPYRWMEDWHSDELKQWVAAQGQYTQEFLNKLPQRDSLLKRINEINESGGSEISTIKAVGGRYFYLRHDSGEGVAKLVVRTGLDGAEKVLFDPNSLEGDVHTSLDWFYPSPDGKYIAYGLSQGGSEESILYILEVDIGKNLPESITRTRFGMVEWQADSQSFFYRRKPELLPGTPETESYHNMKVHLHYLGQDPDTDQAVFGRGLNPAVEMAAADFPYLATFANNSWVLGVAVHGVLSELTIFALPSLNKLKDPAKANWIKIADVEDGVTGYAVKGDTIFLKTHRDALRYKVIATSLAEPDLARAELVIPPSQSVIEQIFISGDYLLSRDLEAGLGKLRRVKLSNTGAEGAPETIELPFKGTLLEVAAEEDKPEALLVMTSWTASQRVYQVQVDQGTLKDTGWLAPAPVDFSGVEAHEVFATSKDGTQVPLSLIHKKGLKLDGRNPTLLMGYGNYGLIAYPSTFNPAMLAWYELGGVLAVAHIRGGGEYGKEWHLAGQKLNKQNNVDDFIASAEYLIANGYTTPPYLAGEGVSGGGIPSGNSLVQRPDLWAVIVMRVAVTNFLRFEYTENGPPNIPEFGTTADEEGFRALQIADSYHKVKDGENYPAVLVTTGLNDPRVVLWQATKMAARLQAASASGKPVLLRVEAQGGHGMGSTRFQINAEVADKLAFLLDQFKKD
jgi:prolyl oligopeptidase